MTGPKLDLLIDLQFGSTGKGLFAGYMANTIKYDTAMSANMPNAGHTYLDEKSRKVMFKCLPIAAISPHVTQVLIGPGAVFDPRRLQEELAVLSLWRDPMPIVRIHPCATVLLESHATRERESLNHIASTMQGSMAATIDKMQRGERAPIAKNVLVDTWAGKLVASYVEWRTRIDCARNIIAEGSQGFSLGINAGFYPFCTSRDCTPAAFMAAMGVPLRYLSSVIGVARTYPIRVGNTPGGYSGDCYPDQEEVKWDKIGVDPEMTTVTGRVRRIFTFSKMQMRDAIWECCPDAIFLNFANYCNEKELVGILRSINDLAGFPIVNWLGYGPRVDNVKVMTYGN